MARSDEKVDSGGRSSDTDILKEEPVPSHLRVSRSGADDELKSFEKAVEGDLNVTEQDLSSAKAHAETLSLEVTRKVISTQKCCAHSG